MKHLQTLYCLTLGLVLAGAGVAAQAAEAGRGYVSLYIGQTEVDFDINNVSVEGDDTAFRIGGGYRVNQNFAIEGFYIDNGEADDTVFGVVDVSVESTAFQFQGVGFLPVSRTVDLYGKVGLGIWDSEFSAAGFGDEDDDGIDLVFGLGASFKLSKDIDLRAEYEFAEFDDADITTIMVGLNIGL